jgi:hypothetical protein
VHVIYVVKTLKIWRRSSNIWGFTVLKRSILEYTPSLEP